MDGPLVWLYDKPSKSKHVNKVELTYIEQDEDLEKIEAGKETETAAEEKNYRLSEVLQLPSDLVIHRR